MTREDQVADIVTHNQKIEDALDECRLALAAIGEPECGMTKGYDFKDIIDMIWDVTPQFGADQYAKVRQYVDDKENAQ